MNYKANIILALTLCTALASCSLDETPRDQIPVESGFTSADDIYRNTVATLYNHVGSAIDGQGLQGTCRGVYDLQTFGSDEAMLPTRGGDWYDGGLWQNMYRHSWGAGLELGKNAWDYLYKVIAPPTPPKSAPCGPFTIGTSPTSSGACPSFIPPSHPSAKCSSLTAAPCSATYSTS